MENILFSYDLYQAKEKCIVEDKTNAQKDILFDQRVNPTLFIDSK